MEILRTNGRHQDFIDLCRVLDKELSERYGLEQEKYDQYNLVDKNTRAVVGYLGTIPVACGCFKRLDNTTIEIKKMYVAPLHRRNGFSALILAELEKWAKQLGHSRAMLETGKGQPEAIGLYVKAGFKVTAHYGPYIGFENSVCMKKRLDMVLS